eukprot:TRINITY_DN47017_c0_g1_i1.p1 TRINITY_DN47017_c0_g1~~TRINITY_DN47017_c0_g1_i1.p1  ORF type:complete len:261 (-),score=20.49 TRINITY_DN47017_c0_g1_i1:214-996(-)
MRSVASKVPRPLAFLTSRGLCHDTLAARALDVGGKRLVRNPTIWWFDAFLSHQECDELQRLARPRLAPSEVLRAGRNSSGDETGISAADAAASGGAARYVRDAARTSLSAALDRGQTTWLLERAAALLDVPASHAETPQVARYLPGERYEPHYDALDGSTPAGRDEMRRAGQRVATLCCYLTDAPAAWGGATTFPRVCGNSEGDAPPFVLHVRPKKGCALLFFPATPEGEVDTRALHAGSPVLQGEKWISQIWVRQRPWL